MNLLIRYTPKDPKTLNFAKTNFFIKGIVLYIDNKFIYIDIGLKKYLKIPLEYCYKLNMQHKKYIKNSGLQKGTIKLIRTIPLDPIKLYNTQNKETFKDLNSIHWTHI